MTTTLTAPTPIPSVTNSFLYCGDNIQSLKELAANSIDSIVTDPPYGLSAHSPADIVAAMTAWASGKEYLVKKKGFMGKTWDSFVPGPELWKEALRVLKPGGHLLCFAGSRTDDLMGISLRLAGFEIRDKIMWIYGSGFPKSLNIAKAIDKAAGVEFEASPASGVGFMGADGPGGYNPTKSQLTRTGDTTAEAAQWAGYGTALKPAFEPIIVARKPLGEKTVATNVLKHGTGGINIDGCRVATDGARRMCGTTDNPGGVTSFQTGSRVETHTNEGRWPANIMHDGSDEVEEAFAEYGAKGGGGGKGVKPGSVVKRASGADQNGVNSPSIGAESRPAGTVMTTHDDTGTASRFFYSSKANSADRADSKHPTVKPVSLMRYLVRLVTPPGGTVLDPFAGSGTTGQAAVEEGFSCILMELETAYQQDIARRFELLKKAKPDTKLICVRPVPPKDSPTP